MALNIEVNGIKNGGDIPVDLTCDGRNYSPQIFIKEAPKDAKSLALIVEDPDAPIGLFVHWVIFNINPNVSMLRSNIEKATRTSEGYLQGKNDFGNVGYDGPCPPRGHGFHRYFFKLFALSSSLNVEGVVTRDKLLRAMEGKILAQAESMGKYKR
jgi:Raf kinase inhibitor-like YbhB/YbcL family protein